MADEYTVDNCGSCHAPIIWAETEKSVAMPVDAEPHPDGTVQLRARPGIKPLAVVLKNPAQRFGKTQLRKSHFAGCPQASEWRKQHTKTGANR